MDESAFDRQRAEWLRRRYRAVSAALAALTVLLSLWTPRLFGSPTATAWAMGPFVILFLAQFRLLGRPRPYRVVERSVAAGGFLVVIGSCAALWFAAASQWRDYATSLLLTTLIVPSLCRLSAAWTASLLLTDVALVAAVGQVRMHGALSLSPSTLFLVALAGVVNALDARGRDRLARAEAEARDRLAEAHQRLLRDEQSRTRLFVNLSHDFRTPLAIIAAEAELLLEAGAPPDSASRIRAQSSLLVDLVDQLLELARLDAGRPPLRSAPIAIDRVVREVAAQLQRPGQQIEISAPPGPTGVCADVRHVRRVLMNLLTNANRQLDRGGSQVRIDVATSPGAVTVDVSDDGPGIPVERRRLVFERFASFDREGSTVSGIGLPLARELATLNNGSLEILECAPRTTFRFTLPAASLDAAEEPLTVREPNPAAPESWTAAPRSAGPVVLVVDDNLAMLDLVRRALAPGFAVAACSRVADALAWLRTNTPRAIVADVLLPEGSGYDLLAAVRERPELGDVPLLLLSALGQPDERVRGLQAGADDYLAKPFSVAELRARVVAAIERADTRRAAIAKLRDDFLMELHDGVAAAVSRAALLVAAIADGHGDARLADVRAALQEALDEARSVMAVLESPSEAWGDFAAELRNELTTLCAQHTIAFSFADRGPPAPLHLLPTATHALRRIGRELLTNVIRHAHAHRAVGTLVWEAEVMRLRIEDDGVGFQGEPVLRRGLGIVRRRAERLGGTVELGARAGGGTFAEVRLPATFRLGGIA